MPDYSNKDVISMKFEELETKIDDNHAETLDKIGEVGRSGHDRQKETINFLQEIKKQTTEHNHRMTKQESLTSGVIMAGCVTIFLGSVIVGLVVYIYQYQLSQQSTRITNLSTKIQQLQEK